MFYNILMRIAKTICITLPPELLTKARKVAIREHRTMSELVREALRHYMAETPEKTARPGSANELTAVDARADDGGSLVVHSFRMEKAQQK
jgi:metal-responsive CopG/Arc/MetJ family transcriptional regulator